MEESREQQKLYSFLQYNVYFFVALDVAVRLYAKAPIWGIFSGVVAGLNHMPFLHHWLYAKLATLLLICLVGIGTLAKKQLDIDPKKHIVFPLCAGLLLMFSSTFVLGRPTAMVVLPYTDAWGLGYIGMSVLGAMLTLTGIDNISKMIQSGLGKDKWNVEGESFMQTTEKNTIPNSVHIPMQFYYKGKVRDGFINLVTVRSTLLLGTPSSGKSYGVVGPFIRQMVANGTTLCLYDFKFPDLAQIAYYHYCLARQKGKLEGYQFHVLNPDEPERSRKVNPLRADYIRTLADASETAEALVEALKKGDKSSGSDQFFTQSAINFLASAIYFLSKHEDGRYSTLPHLLSFLNRSYEEIFTMLFSNVELHSLLSPFMSAFKNRTYEQLEGQVGTLKIFISRLATKETFWVFGSNDFELKVSDRKHPGILVLANNPSTQSINSALYSVVLNRLSRLVNSKGNIPVGIIIDEAPTLYFHRVDLLCSTARSNLVSVLLGLQELPMLSAQYGKETANTITAIVGNVISGSVRNKETLEWLERICGKVKQKNESLSIDRNKVSVSINERLEPLIPAGKIAALKTGNMVGLVADEEDEYTGKFKTSAVHCKINLDDKAIRREEAGYRPTPIYYRFNGNKDAILMRNFLKIKHEVEQMTLGFMGG